MKYLSTFIVLLIFATTTFAQNCFPPGAQFGRFLKTLEAEGRYDGKGDVTIYREGQDPISKLLDGHYEFTRQSYGTKVHSILCDSQECDEGETRWTIRRGCLLVNGVRVRVTISTTTRLRYTFTTGTSSGFRDMRLFPGRILNISGEVSSPGYRATETFYGVGSR